MSASRRIQDHIDALQAVLHVLATGELVAIQPLPALLPFVQVASCTEVELARLVALARDTLSKLELLDEWSTHHTGNLRLVGQELERLGQSGPQLMAELDDLGLSTDGWRAQGESFLRGSSPDPLPGSAHLTVAQANQHVRSQAPLRMDTPAPLRQEAANPAFPEAEGQGQHPALAAGLPPLYTLSGSLLDVDALDGWLHQISQSGRRTPSADDLRLAQQLDEASRHTLGHHLVRFWIQEATPTPPSTHDALLVMIAALRHVDVAMWILDWVSYNLEVPSETRSQLLQTCAMFPEEELPTDMLRPADHELLTTHRSQWQDLIQDGPPPAG